MKHLAIGNKRLAELTARPPRHDDALPVYRHPAGAHKTSREHCTMGTVGFCTT